MLRCEPVVPESPHDAIWQDWRNLMPRCGERHQLFAPDWVRIWSETWGATGHWSGHLVLLAVRDEQSRLVGILPLARPRTGPLRVYATGGHDVPHRGIVCEEWMDRDVGAAIGDFLADQSWPLVQLGPLRLDSFPDQAMLRRLRERSMVLQPTAWYDQISLHAPDDWDTYVRSVISNSLIRDVRRKERRMRSDGMVSIRHYRQPTAEETETLFRDLAAIESSSWMATHPDAVPRFSNPDLCRFWRELTLRYLSPHDRIDCWVMTFDGTPVSFCFTICDGTTRFVIANNYSRSVRRYSTGSILYWQMMREGIERGLRCFEFGDGHLHYKQRWGACVDGCRQTFTVSPSRLLAGAARMTRQLTSLFSVRVPV